MIEPSELSYKGAIMKPGGVARPLLVKENNITFSPFQFSSIQLSPF